MEEQKKHHDWRLVTVGVFFGFGILYTLFLFFTRPPISQTEPQPISLNSPTPYPVRTTAKAQMYSSQAYDFTFPVDWVYEEIPTTNGAIVSVKPSTNPQGDYVPSLKVEIVALAQTDEVYRNELLTPYPNTETIIVQGQSARKTRISGTSKIVDGKIIKAPVQEVDIQFDKDETRYIIRYLYPGESEDPSIERQFMQMVSSLQVH